MPLESWGSYWGHGKYMSSEIGNRLKHAIYVCIRFLIERVNSGFGTRAQIAGNINLILPFSPLLLLNQKLSVTVACTVSL